MQLRVLRVAMLMSVGLTLVASQTAHAKGPDIYPLSKVRRGQKGYGLTVMSGTKPTRFTFEVIGVKKNFLPKMDIILVKSDDPKLKTPGFWAGMSGSPLFIEGKLACAFSYGYAFNKVAIGGCTPLHYMKKEGFGTRRRNLTTAKPRSGKRALIKHRAASLQEWRNVAPKGTAQSAFEAMGAPRKPWLMRAPLPPRRSPSIKRMAASGMVPAAVPLSMSGFNTQTFNTASKLFSAYPLQPMRAGGTGNAKKGPRRLHLGSQMAVQLLRGDMAISTFGTVSYVDGQRLLAFGHPMFRAGEIYAPIASAVVHTVIPSAKSPFVVSSPMRELGVTVQDRQSTIMADTSLKTRMIPMDIYVRNGTKEKAEFHVQLLNNRFYTSRLASLAAMNAISLYLPDRDRASISVVSTIKVRGYKALRFVDHLYHSQGARRLIGGARGLRALTPLLMNPFAAVHIERMEMRVKITYGTNFGKISRIRLVENQLKPGKRNHVDVYLTTHGGKIIRRRIPFDVPKKLAGSIVRLEVAAGDNAHLDAAPTRSFPQLMAALGKLLPGNVFAVTLYTASEGVAINGRLIKDLPSSALDKLRPSTATTRAKLYRPIVRSTSPATRVINGKIRQLVKVRDL